jgi:hypothetical protein
VPVLRIDADAPNGVVALTGAEEPVTACTR